MVNLPPDLVTKILSIEWGISVLAIIMTFLEMPLLIKMRSPSRIVARFSLLRLSCMGQSYHCRFREANHFFAAANIDDEQKGCPVELT
jgi:hypothetical protein